MNVRLRTTQGVGLNIETIADAELITNAADDRLTVAVKASDYWEASQDLHKRLSESANN